MAEKLTQTKTLQYIGIISEALLQGWSNLKIKTMLERKTGLKPNVTDRLIKYIMEKWNKQGEQDMPLKRNRAIARYEHALQNAYAIGDISLATRILTQLSDIEGTRYDAELAMDKDVTFRIEVVGNDEDTSEKDDLDNPGQFEKRMEKQLGKFCKEYGVKK